MNNIPIDIVYKFPLIPRLSSLYFIELIKFFLVKIKLFLFEGSWITF